ncbi:MAG: SurA N-terminal domain-containing protein [Pseudomonadota bacterium]|nr:SurA N-terminal domain-containing protein [Pseudomonadota bacterium]
MLLESMKKGVGKYVMILLASLLILSFAVWGVGDMVGVISNPDEVATVGDTKITQRQFQIKYRQQLNEIRSRIGNINSKQARNLGLAEITLNSIIDKRLIELQAHDLGLMVSDDIIRAKIRQEPAFRNKVGEFDPSIFRTLLANNGLTEATYVASVKQDLQRTYITGTLSSGSLAPPQLTNILFQHQNERRIAEIILIKRQITKNTPIAKDTDLKNYLNKHSSYFMAPEYRKMSVLYLDPKEIAKDLSPSKQRIREEYEDRLGSLIVPETRELEQILFKDETSARKAFTVLSNGQNFSIDGLRNLNGSAKKTSIGFVSKGDLLPELANSAFSLNRNTISEPIKTSLGWHIIKLVNIKPGRTPALQEVQSALAADISREMAVEVLIKRADKIEDTLAGGASIDNVGRELGMKIHQTDFMDVSGTSTSGTKVKAIPEDPRFIQTAFNLKKDETSELIETPEGGYFMVRVDKITLPKKQKLRKVRKLVEEAWRNKQLNDVAKRTAQKIQKRAKTIGTLKEVAKTFGLKSFETGPVSRFGATGSNVIPREILPRLFKAKIGDVVIAQTAEGYAVARLTNIKNKQKAVDKKNFDRLQKVLSTALSDDVLQQYAKALRKEYSVSINKTALQKYFSNSGP